MTTYLITGASGGLGASVLAQLRATLPASDTLIAASSDPKREAHFRSLGVEFRLADYNDEASLRRAFSGVDKLLFTSSPTFSTPTRNAQHAAVISAARATPSLAPPSSSNPTSRGHVYYTSLAFGGLSSTSRVAVQAAHLATEALLAESGLRYTSVRMGLYADAFPLFLDWAPGDGEVVVPEYAGSESGGGLAVALRSELGEATANIMSSGHHDSSPLILLSGPDAITMDAMVRCINTIRHPSVDRSPVVIRRVGPDAYVAAQTAKLGGGEVLEGFFWSRLSWFEGLAQGDGAVVTGTLGEALGRAPTGGREAVEGLLREGERAGGYRWHQSEAVAAMGEGKRA